MTYEETIKEITLYECEGCSALFCKECKFWYAIEALAKHTPKKPNWLYDDEPYCPTCQCALREYEEVCGECTQLIDWGE